MFLKFFEGIVILILGILKLIVLGICTSPRVSVNWTI